MSRTALLKIDRASERIIELSNLLDEERPFRYILETNTITRERATFAKHNQAVIDRAGLIAGDAVHNIRSSLDHAWWAIVSPLVPEPRARRFIQFPFSETATRLEDAVSSRLAQRVSEEFFRAVVRLKPHGEAGGNRLLYLIDQLDIPDKHRTLPPTANYTRINSRIIQQQVPDFPSGILDGGFGMNRRDIVWKANVIHPATLGTAVPPTTYIFEKELDVPVDIIFEIDAPYFRGPLVPTLNQLVDVARETIAILRKAAGQ